MTIIEALVKLRNDLKLWVTNNLRVKMDKNLGAEEKDKLLSVDENGDIVTTEIDSLELITVDDIDEICVITEIFPKTTLTFTRHSASSMPDTVLLVGNQLPIFVIELGSTYHIILDNKMYECVGADFTGYGYAYIGDETFCHTNTWGNSGFPFLARGDNTSGVIYINSTETVHTVAIYKVGN